MTRLLLCLVAFSTALTSAFSQATIGALNSAYTQNFNTLISTGSAAWADNSTLAGWYARTTATASLTTYSVNTGSVGTTFGLYSYGSTSASDRALGFVSTNGGTGSGGSNYIGLQVTNSAGLTATSFTLAYDGEQWRRENNAAAHTLVVQYAFNAASVTDTGVTWTTISDLTFTSPIVGATTGAALDGNASANRATLSASTNATWLAGDNLWIRWVDLNDSGNDHILAIDNVSLTAIPEPSTYAALFGALALAGVVLHRRRRENVT